MMKRFCILLMTATAAGTAQTPPVAITYSTNGLTSITYNGFQYLSYGNFGVNGITMVNSAGTTSAGSTSGTASYDTAHQRTTIKFNWGKIVVAYATSAGKLSLTITTSNTSPLTIQGVFYEPFGLQFPSAPREFDSVNPIVVINNGNATALRMTAGANAVVLANDDVVQPLLVGFPWSLNKPANTIFPVRVETSQDSMLPNSIPFVNRPIAPGASDAYHLSLRFGPASATTKSLASDVYQSFATVYPFTVQWPDRRPIGQLIMGSTATAFPTNPRGWFNDPSVDVTTPQGVAAFQARVLAWAQNAVTILKSMNAQGMVTWDIEGEQYPQPTTYIGDPTLFGTLAPEMTGVIDQYFKTFSSAGLRVGICIRPQQLVIQPGGGAPTQTTVPNPTQLLLNKVAYAYQHWGATLFYIDSNGDPNFPISSSFFKTVAAQFPNVLLIPEHQTASYFGFGSWYGELRGGFTGTPPAVLDIYPSAFSVIYLPDGNFQQNSAALKASANRGDIMMFRAWYADPQNQEILNLYPPNGVAGPAPSLVTPANSGVVSGIATIAASVAAGPAGLAGVQYVLDGVNLGSLQTAPPFALPIDTSTLATGIHQIQAVASDPLGDLGFATGNFFVSASPVNPPPAVTLVSPSNGSTVSGEVLLSATVTDALPATVQFTLDGANAGPLLTQQPFAMYLDSTTLTGGPHTLGAVATDQIGLTGAASGSFSVQGTSLTVAITAPAAGSTVSSSVVIAAAVSGTAPIAGVQFSVDGIAIGNPVAAAPYSVNWISNGAPNGPHTLTAAAFDIYGNSASASVSIVVQNSVSSGLLSGSVAAATGIQPLTSLGTLDWIHWGLNGASGLDRKANVPAQISSFSLIGSAPIGSYANNPAAFSWSDGSPSAQMTSTTTGVFVTGQNNGFTLRAPADATPRTLTVYAGSYRAQIAFTAALSDFSAPVYQDTSVVSLNGQTAVAYTISYAAASPGQSLFVTVAQAGRGPDPWSNVTLQAAALSPLTGNPGALTGLVSTPAATQNLTALGTADWVQWNGNGLSATDRKANVAAQLPALALVGTSPEFAYSNNPFAFAWNDGTPVNAATAVTSGAYAMGLGSGFSLTVPADTNWRTLTVFAGVYKTQGKLTAVLSDGSAPVFSDTSISSATGQLGAAYTLHYKAASSGQSLTITYTQANAGASPYSNVTFQAASLAMQ